jgi:hypothetical protein
MEEKAFAQQKEKSRTKDRSNRVAYFRFTSANSRQNMSRRVALQPRRVDIVLRVCLQNYAGFWVACFRARVGVWISRFALILQPPLNRNFWRQ